MRQGRLLIISYMFPPAGGVNVQRVLSFARYLPEHFESVSVLMPRNGEYGVRDPALIAQVPACVRIYKALTPELPFYFRKKLLNAAQFLRRPGAGPAESVAADTASQGAVGKLVSRMAIPDPQAGWVRFAVRRAREIIRREQIDTLLISGPPFSALRAGAILKREFPGVKLISDFRDEWLGYFLSEVAPPVMHSREAREKCAAIERDVIAASDFVVAVTPSTCATIRARYPEQPQAKFLCVPNGYDPAAFADFRPRPNATGRMAITYLGTVYGPCSPAGFLDVLDGLPEEVRSQIEVRFIGRVIPSEQPGLENRKARVVIYGFLPQAEGIRLLEETDAALLIVDNRISLAGKTFEYLVSGKPVLAVSPAGGETARVIAETGAGWCADPREPAAIRRMLLDAYERFRSGNWPPSGRNEDAIRRYERPSLVAELVRQVRQGK